jgi:inorganic pyrophosphatase
MFALTQTATSGVLLNYGQSNVCQESNHLHSVNYGTAVQGHPWHGVPLGQEAPRIVTTYIEIVPTDSVKYERKASACSKLIVRNAIRMCARSLWLSPQTLCAEQVGARAEDTTDGIEGDGDPLISASSQKKSFLVVHDAGNSYRLHMIDEIADDKIIAVMQDDAVYGVGKRLVTVLPL